MYTKEELEEAVKISYNYSETIRNLDRQVTGASHRIIKQKIEKYKINIDHFDPYKKIRETLKANKRDWKEILVVRDTHSGRQKTPILKNSLLESGREYKCEECKNTGEWNGRPLTLQIDHKNNINTDDSPENLRFLCPNCHSQDKSHYTKKTYNCECGNKMHRDSKHCHGCANKLRGLKCRKVDRPNIDVILSEVKEMGYCATGRKYGVSDNSIRKWIKNASMKPA